jgi:hypothetical protein
LAKAGAGAEEQGADGGGRFVEHGGDGGGVEFVDSGEEKDGALGLGEGVDGGEGGGDGALLGEELVGGEVGGYEGFYKAGFELAGADAAFAVEGEVPGDADEPDAEVFDLGELVAVLQDAEEGVLHGVFGLCAVPQDGMGNAEEERGVGFHESGEVDLRPDLLRGWQRQTVSLKHCHLNLLQGQTGGWGKRSDLFCGEYEERSRYVREV